MWYMWMSVFVTMSNNREQMWTSVCKLEFVDLSCVLVFFFIIWSWKRMPRAPYGLTFDFRVSYSSVALYISQTFFYFIYFFKFFVFDVALKINFRHLTCNQLGDNWTVIGECTQTELLFTLMSNYAIWISV